MKPHARQSLRPTRATSSRQRYCCSECHTLRDGLTILEVIISTGIFLAAMTVLTSLVTSGNQARVRAQRHTQAVFHAQTKMAEILVGIEAPDAVVDAPIEDDDEGWYWSYEPQYGEDSDLIVHEVTVYHTRSTGSIDGMFTLRRIARDPEAYATDSTASTTE